MSIINGTYYSRDINLIDTQIADVNNEWQSVYEEIILKKLLGYDLYTLYVADLATTPATPQNPTLQRFKDLVDGKAFTFEYNGYTISTKWEGLRNQAKKISLIAYFVYYHYRNETESFNSGAGQVKSLTVNSTKANITPKLVYSWNKMIELYGEIPKNLSKDYFINIDNYEHYNIMPSAYNFLLANKDTYPEWVFEPLETQNIFGI